MSSNTPKPKNPNVPKKGAGLFGRAARGISSGPDRISRAMDAEVGKLSGRDKK